MHCVKRFTRSFTACTHARRWWSGRHSHTRTHADNPHHHCFLSRRRGPRHLCPPPPNSLTHFLPVWIYAEYSGPLSLSHADVDKLAFVRVPSLHSFDSAPSALCPPPPRIALPVLLYCSTSLAEGVTVRRRLWVEHERTRAEDVIEQRQQRATTSGTKRSAATHPHGCRSAASPAAARVHNDWPQRWPAA